MSDKKNMSTVGVYAKTLRKLNMLRKPREKRVKHEPYLELLADVVERAVKALEEKENLEVA